MGISEEELEMDLQERLADTEHLHTTDEALNSALLVSARAEISQLRAVVAAGPRIDEVCSFLLNCELTYHLKG